MVDVHGMKLADVARLIRSRQHSAVEFTEAYLERIEKYNARLNAYLKVFTEEALAEAAKADKEIEEGTVRGPLHGVPIALKDIIDIAGHVTTAGGILLPDAPAEQDAEVTRRLRAAGAVLIGKLNLHEYAWGGTTDNPHYGRCYNPWKEGYSPGGSSGGSGAAVAADLCAAALGTDTLGSIRIPSSYCGTVGFKPTYGLVSTRGVYPLSWALDSVGPLARSVEDAAIVLG
ncbi:amidase, partial [Candidatus Sumerlaeota bacterium]|nr:amidase [Candidatus Sumerlaeota bacterium]